MKPLSVAHLTVDCTTIHIALRYIFFLFFSHMVSMFICLVQLLIPVSCSHSLYQEYIGMGGVPFNI